MNKVVLIAERPGQAATTTWASFAELAEYLAVRPRQRPETPPEGDAAPETEERP